MLNRILANAISTNIACEGSNTVQIAYAISQCSYASEHACSLDRAFISFAHAQNGRTYGIFFQSILRRDLVCMQSARAFTALAHIQNGCIYGIFYQSMLKQTLACVQSHQSLHCSNTCTKRAYIRHIPSVNAQTRLSMRAVSPEPLLLSTCSNWVYIRQILSVNTQTRLSTHAVLPQPFLFSHVHKMGVQMA